MAVDVYIHVVEPEMDATTLRCIFHNHLGHPLENLEYRCPLSSDGGRCVHRDMLRNSDAVKVGSKHWRHPWWTGQAPEHLNDPISEVANAFLDFETVSPELIEEIKGAYRTPSTETYNMEGLGEYRDQVVAFLNRHMGDRIFMIGW